MGRLARLALVVLIVGAGAYGVYSFQGRATTTRPPLVIPPNALTAPENDLADAGFVNANVLDLEDEVKSDFSHIRVRRNNNVRTLWFVRDGGEEVIESQVIINRPHDLIVEYTRYMFLSYIFCPKPSKVLIVGLGGGAMVHFLKHYDPQVKVDVLEIDPAIVKIADKWFDVQSGGNVKVHTVDGFKYLKETESRYDVIYMDAFLKPAADTDKTGVPLRLKTIDFYKAVQEKLEPNGLVVYNINPHPKVQDDIKTIAEAFPQTYVFEMPRQLGYVVVGAMSPQRLERRAILTNADALQRRFRVSYSFPEMARSLVSSPR